MRRSNYVLFVFSLIGTISFLAYMSLFRLPRLARYYNLGIFFDRLDQNLPFPLFIRLTRTVNTMVYLVHLAGCAYYGFSKIEGIGSTRKISTYDNMIYENVINCYCKLKIFCIKSNFLIIL